VTSLKLTGKHIVITGASAGVGEKIAYEVAKRGATPILLARSEEKLKEIASDIQSNYQVPCCYYRLDVSDLTAVESVFTHLFHELKTVDVLVNNGRYRLDRNEKNV
jgi:uncharacterized protein